MRWNVEEWRQNQSVAEFPVVLISESVSPVLTAVLEESRAVGIEVLLGPNGAKPVICVCTDQTVFAIESSLLTETEVRVFLTFLAGFSATSAVPLVSVNSGIGAQLSPLSNLDLSLVSIRVVPPRIALRKLDMQTISTDPAALAMHFGSTCYLAREVFGANAQAISKPVVSETSVPVSIYQSLSGTESQAQKRQRTLPLLFAAPDDRAMEPVPTVHVPPQQPVRARADVAMDPRDSPRLNVQDEASPGPFEFQPFSYSPMREGSALDTPASGETAALFVEDTTGEPVNSVALAATEALSRVSVLDENGMELSEQEIAVLGEENARRFLQCFR